MARLCTSGVITHDTGVYGRGPGRAATRGRAKAVEKTYQAELAKALKAAAGRQSDGDEDEHEQQQLLNALLFECCLTRALGMAL